MQQLIFPFAENTDTKFLELDGKIIPAYDKYIVTFSGGKDSLACLLWLLDQGVDKNKIELWHHHIDGEGNTFFDWEITKDYCIKLAQAFGIKIYFQWKEGGFKRELLRDQQLTAPTCFEMEDGTVKKVGGTSGKLNTRRKFPQLSADLKVRWCSAYLKIDVCATAIRNQKRFEGIRTLVLSGERGEESDKNFLSKLPEDRTGRGAYAMHEIDKSGGTRKKIEGKSEIVRSGKRYVDRLRPIRDWTEFEVWEIIRRYRVNPHPAYHLGWSRVSCKFCIFGNADQFKSASIVSPETAKEIIDLESEFKCSMKRDTYLPDFIKKGNAYEMDSRMITIATSYEYNEPIFVDNWTMPKGAFGESCGPK